MSQTSPLQSNRAVLSDVVTDEFYQVVPNVVVCLECSSLIVAETVTDELGQYRISIHPEPKTYNISATVDSQGHWELGIRLDKGKKHTTLVVVKVI